MLFDPKWNRPNPQPMTLPHLIAWLETKPAGELYDYVDWKHCLAAQYCEYVGVKYSPSKLRYNPVSIFRLTMEDIADGPVQTFGAALRRAREELQRQEA